MLKRLNFKIPEQELEILEQLSEATDRTKTDILRELIRSLKGKSEVAQPPESSRKLTKADVTVVISALYDKDLIDSPLTAQELAGYLLEEYDFYRGKLTSPRKLTRADVTRVISCINDAGWFQGYVEEDQTVDELIANYPDLVE